MNVLEKIINSVNSFSKSERKVADVILNMDRTANIILATALGNVAGDNVISKISIVYKVRIADDRITLRHMPNYVELQMNVSTVEK